MTQRSWRCCPRARSNQFEAAAFTGPDFTTPALLEDWTSWRGPSPYVTWDVRSTDKQTHDVPSTSTAAAKWVVDRAEQAIVWGRYKVGDMEVLRVGSKEQAVLAKAGDNCASTGVTSTWPCRTRSAERRS